MTADKNSPATKHAPSAKKLPKGTHLDPIFAILQDIPDAHLLSVAADSCVLFPADPSAAAETLSILRANELAQAALASTRCRLEAEKAQAAAQVAAESASMASASGGAELSCPEGGPQCVPGEAAGAAGAAFRSKQRSPSPPRVPPRRRAKSVAPQGRRPVTRQARANGVDL